MNEVITYHSKEAEYQLQILDEFMASLDADRLLSTNDLYAAADSFLGIEHVSADQLDADLSVHEPDVTNNILPVNSYQTVLKTPKPNRTHETAKRRLVTVGKCAAAVIVVVMGVRGIEAVESSMDSVSKEPAAAAMAPEPTVESTPTTQAATKEPTIMPVALRVTEPIRVPAVPEATTTTITTITVAEAAPAELTLTQKILANETTLAENRGMPLGTLRLDKYCDTVKLFINNPVDYTIAENVPYLSADAQAKAALLAGSDLSREERRMYADDIMQFGLPNGSGDPLYAAYPDNTPEDGCIPAQANPRASRVAYGSTPVVQAGGYADQYQSTAVISEYGTIPGAQNPANTVTYISGHNTSQNASFNGLRNYTEGDTITHVIDGQIKVYKMVALQEINGKQNFTEIIALLNAQAAGKEQIVLQVCIDGNPDDRSLYIFELA